MQLNLIIILVALFVASASMSVFLIKLYRYCKGWGSVLSCMDSLKLYEDVVYKVHYNDVVKYLTIVSRREGLVTVRLSDKPFSKDDKESITFATYDEAKAFMDKLSIIEIKHVYLE